MAAVPVRTQADPHRSGTGSGRLAPPAVVPRSGSSVHAAVSGKPTRTGPVATERASPKDTWLSPGAGGEGPGMCSEGSPAAAGTRRPGRAHTYQVEPGPGSLAKYFDGWHADMTGSPVKDEIQQRQL